MSQAVQTIVVGAGVVGLATARALAQLGVEVAVIEAEPRPAAHQSGHNSGVIHAGLYYEPGSLKARLCREGRAELIDLLEARDVPHARPGKLVIAATDDQLPRLRDLHERGRANGLIDMQWLTAEALREHEPDAAGIAALAIPETGITDFTRLADGLVDELKERGVEVRLDTRLLRVDEHGDGVQVTTTAGTWNARGLVACAGLQADRVARACGVEPGITIVPFRGAYRRLAQERADRMRHLLYPVPDPELPFLGVHVTPMIDGGVELGPTAVLAWDRHSDHEGGFCASDALTTLGSIGAWKLFARRARTGLSGYIAAHSERAFLHAARQLLPDLRADELVAGRSGLRAQAVDRRGRLVDDFAFVTGRRSLHVLNAPSPAATASLAIGRHVAQRAAGALGL